MLSHDHPLLLASASPRRRELLERMAIPLVVAAVDVDESVPPGVSPREYLDQVVALKLAAARELLGGTEYHHCAAVLVADTVVVAGDDVLGKPANDEHAADMLQLLSGMTHQVLTRFALTDLHAAGTFAHSQTVITEVRFRVLLPGEVESYVATGEGQDKAGGYAIQGIGAGLVEGVAGSYTNVVGLPLAEVLMALAAARLWQPGYRADHA